MMLIRNLIKRIMFPNRYSSEAYLNYMRKLGCQIGENCYIFNPETVSIDVARPYLLKMGNNVVMARDVTILTHDYSHVVSVNKYGEQHGDAKDVTIGNNVFLGIDSMILMGTSIGDNVIVGAKSVVRGNIPDNVVVAGNPAKIICTLEEFYKKRIKEEVECAVQNVKISKERLGRVPTIKEMGDAFGWLYLPHTKETMEQFPEFFQLVGTNEKKLEENFLNSKSRFHSYEEFIDWILRGEDN